MVNRTESPGLADLNYEGFPKFETLKLASGVEVYFIENKLDEACRLDVVLPAGSVYQNKPLQASFYSGLLFSGTREMSALQVAEKMDFYGSYYGAEADKDLLTIAFYGLSENISEILDFAGDVIQNADFPNEEFQKHCNVEKQKMLVNLEKVSFRARKIFAEKLFSSGAYGNTFDVADFDNIKRDDILSYHNKLLTLQPVFFFVGKRDEQIFNALNEFSSIFGKQTQNYQENYTDYPIDDVHDEKKDAIQTAVRIGKLLPLIKHPDFYDLKIFNTLLGGYFGSRLMMNLREDKGWTYGIGSAVLPFKQASYFGIATEVNGEQAERTVQEIVKEIKLLQETPVPTTELEMVKNYTKGKLLRSLDGPFSLIERLKTKWKFDLPLNHEELIMNAISNIDSERITALANEYFDPNKFLIVTSGKRDRNK